MFDLGEAGADDETPLVNPADDGTWVVPDATPSWAVSSVPSGISQEDLADKQQAEALVNRWRRERERGEVQANLEFASSTKGELWLRWGSRWLLLTYKNNPKELLAPSTIERKYLTNVAKALGVDKESTRLPRPVVAALSKANQELGKAAESVETIGLQDLGQTMKEATDTVQTMETTFTELGQSGDPPLTQREILGLSRALETTR